MLNILKNIFSLSALLDVALYVAHRDGKNHGPRPATFPRTFCLFSPCTKICCTVIFYRVLVLKCAELCMFSFFSICVARFLQWPSLMFLQMQPSSLITRRSVMNKLRRQLRARNRFLLVIPAPVFDRGSSLEGADGPRPRPLCSSQCQGTKRICSYTEGVSHYVSR